MMLTNANAPHRVQIAMERERKREGERRDLNNPSCLETKDALTFSITTFGRLGHDL